MKMTFHSIVKTVIHLGGLFFLLGCGERIASRDGDATETGNARVSGHIVLANGGPSQGTVVSILPENFNPIQNASVPDSLKDTTDSNGGYHFKTLSPGNYSIEAMDSTQKLRLSIFDIKVSGTDSKVLGYDTLYLPGSVILTLPTLLDTGWSWIYIPGTTIKIKLDSVTRKSGKVIISNLPAQLIPSINYSTDSNLSKPIILAENVLVHTNSNTTIDPFTLWSHSSKLVLNTSMTGVSITQNQTQFPLLVRLSNINFDFSTAQKNGEDLRFTKADGTPLAAEIELFDSSKQQATVWVHLDTLFADSSIQFIKMFWGNKSAIKLSMPTKVFDTSTGFVSDLHFGEYNRSNGSSTVFKDATGASQPAEGHFSSTKKFLPVGIVGNGIHIDSNDYILAPQVSSLLKSPKSFSISIWYRTNEQGMGPAGGDLCNVGNNYGLRVFHDSTLHFWFWPATPPAGVGTDWYGLDIKDSSILDANWHWVMGTYDGKIMHLYLDGKQKGSAPAAEPVAFQFPLNLTLGRHGQGFPGAEYRGDLDEARIESKTRGSDWIKLTFENQKENSLFPLFTIP